MTVVGTTQDTEALSLTLVSELAAPPARVWQVWADPRQLERWWGPPTWPATFVQHDLVPGGEVGYFMTGPDGTKARGWWKVLTVEEPRLIEFEDGFSDESGVPDPSMPVTRARVELAASPTGTTMTLTSWFATSEQRDQLASMGMVEGMTSALGRSTRCFTATELPDDARAVPRSAT
jgi:uncharacterized protein YndB with AHSA1/START domain